MGFFGRIKVGFGLAKRSGQLLGAHPKLLAFPLVGGLAGILFMVTLFGGLLVGGLLDEPGVGMYAVLFVAYVVETFVASFFAAALVDATRTVFHGEEPSLRASMAAAWNHKWPLLAWSVIAAVIGVVIQAIESSDNIAAEILASLFAVAWSVMTYFIVPVIVFEDPSVTGMFKQSASTFKNTWGESIGAMGAINIVTFLFVLLGVAVAAAAFFVLPGGGTVALTVTLIVGGSAIVFGLLVGKALTGIAKTALYVFATENTAPEFFEDMDFSRLGGDSSGQNSVRI